MAASNTTAANRSHAAAFEPKNLRVLVVDSKGSSREQISNLLRDCCYQVAQSRTSKEALALLATKTAQGYEPAFDLILKEHEPPVADACRLLRKLAKSEHLRQVPVVVVSSQDDRELVSKCLNNGATDYLVKPLRNNELRNIWTRVWWWRKVSAGRIGDAGVNTFYPDLEYDAFPSSGSEPETVCDDDEEPTSREGSATGNGNGAGNGSNGNGSNGSKEGNGTSRVEAKTIHGSNNGMGNGSSDEKNGNGNSATKNGTGNGSNHNGSNGNGASTTLVPEWPSSVVATAEGAKPSPPAHKQMHTVIPTSKQLGEDDTQTSKDMSALHPWADVQERSGGRGAFTQYTSSVQRKRSSEAVPSVPSSTGAVIKEADTAPVSEIKEPPKHKANSRLQARTPAVTSTIKPPSSSGTPTLANTAPSEDTTHNPTIPKAISFTASLPIPALDTQPRPRFTLSENGGLPMGPVSAHFPHIPATMPSIPLAVRPHFPVHLPPWMAPNPAHASVPSGVHPLHAHHHLPANGFPGLPYPAGLSVPLPPFMSPNGAAPHSAAAAAAAAALAVDPTSMGAPRLPTSTPQAAFPHVPTTEVYAEMLRRHQEASRNMESFQHHPHAYNHHFMSMLMMAQSGAPMPPQLAAWMRSSIPSTQGVPHAPSLQAQPSSSTTTGISHQLAAQPPGCSLHHHNHHPHSGNLEGSQGGLGNKSREVLVSPDPSGAEGGVTSAGKNKISDTKRHRSAAVERYRKKRKNLKYSKKIRYECRQALAQTRPRVKGQFVKHGKNSQPANGKDAKKGTAMEEEEDDEYDEDEDDDDMEEEEDDMEEDEDEQEAESVDNQPPGNLGPLSNQEELHAVHSLFELQHANQRMNVLHEERQRARLPPLIHPSSSLGSGGKARTSNRRQTPSRQQSSGSAFQNITPMNSSHSHLQLGQLLPHQSAAYCTGLGSESGSNSPVRHTTTKSNGHHRSR